MTTVRQIGTLSLPTDAEDGQVLGWTGSGWGPVDQAAGAGTVTSVNSVTPVSGAVTLAKSDIGLSNVDNTSDANKPVSTAASTALALKAPLASPAFTGTPTGITKAHVGLGNVDNTADTAKPVSTAQQTALDLKAPLASPTFTGTPAVPTAAGGTNSTQAASTAFVKASIDALVAGAPGALDTLSEIATQLASDESAVSALTTTVAGKVPATRTIAGHDLTADVSLAKADVGLSNVDNTSDANKPVSTAQQTALNLKANDNAVVHQTEALMYARLYASGAWQVRGSIPSNGIVTWLGPVSVGQPPIGGAYAVAGVDYYEGTED